jgi:hypothetical protein
MRRLRGVRTTYDVLVVGGGVMGAWTAAIAARRGATVALADQFEPVHARGSSHGDGRIFRLAYHQDHYVDMMLHSLPLWQQLQDFAGEPLMATTGGMNIASVRGGVEGTGALADLQKLPLPRPLPLPLPLPLPPAPNPNTNPNPNPNPNQAHSPTCKRCTSGAASRTSCCRPRR